MRRQAVPIGIKRSVAKAICKRWGLPLMLRKAHKYISRWQKNGKWDYRYPSDQNKGNSIHDAKSRIALKTTPIKDIQPLSFPAESVIKDEIEKLKRLSRMGKLICPALGGRNVYIDSKFENHAKRTKGSARTMAAYFQKVRFLPFVQEVLKRGKVLTVSYRRKGVSENKRTTYSIVCRIKATQAVEVTVAYDKQKNLYLLSLADFNIKKALPKLDKALGHFAVDPATLKHNYPLQGDTEQTNSHTVSSHSPLQPKKSIPHPTKNASENRSPRLVVRKSVARRALCTPLPRLAFTKSGCVVVRW